MTRIFVQKPSKLDALLLAAVAFPLVGTASWLSASYYPENYLLVIVTSIFALTASVAIAGALVPKQILTLDENYLILQEKNQKVIFSLQRANLTTEVLRSDEGDASGRGGLFLLKFSTPSQSLTLLGSLDKYNLTTPETVIQRPWRELYDRAATDAWQIPSSEDLTELLIALKLAEPPEGFSVTYRR